MAPVPRTPTGSVPGRVTIQLDWPGSRSPWALVRVGSRLPQNGGFFGTNRSFEQPCDRYGQKLYDEAVTVDMIVDGQVTVGELAEINVNGAVLDALPKAIEAWRAKVRDPKDLDPRKLTK